MEKKTEIERREIIKKDDINDWMLHRFILDNNLMQFDLIDNGKDYIKLTDGNSEMRLEHSFNYILMYINEEYIRSYEWSKSLSGNLIWRCF